VGCGCSQVSNGIPLKEGGLIRIGMVAIEYCGYTDYIVGCHKVAPFVISFAVCSRMQTGRSSARREDLGGPGGKAKVWGLYRWGMRKRLVDTHGRP
jgi:hypothetical protein